jgi:hypothetical protein
LQTEPKAHLVYCESDWIHWKQTHAIN